MDTHTQTNKQKQFKQTIHKQWWQLSPPARAAPARAAPRAAPAPAPARAPAPAQAPPAAAPMQQQQGPGMMGRIAETAAGVAAGHVMANAVTGMMSGGGGGQEPAPAQQAQPANAGYANSAPPGPCGFEYQQFMHCMQQSNNDLNYCQQYSDMFSFCKKQNGL